MVAPTRISTDIEAFETFINLPENTDKRFELLMGEAPETPSNIFSSFLAPSTSMFIASFLIQNRLEGYLTGEGGGYVVEGEVFAPDVAYTTQPVTRKGFAPHPPLLAVEVLPDPHNNKEQSDPRRKLSVYLRAGVVVWVVDYEAEQVEVHVPDQDVLILGVNDTLKGGDVLPNFALLVRDIFPIGVEESAKD